MSTNKPFGAFLNEALGDEITIYEILLYEQWKAQNTARKPAVFITYRDKNHVKKVKMLKNLEREIFFIKPEYHHEFTTIRDCYPVERTYSSIIPYNMAPKKIYDELCQFSDPISKKYKGIFDKATQLDDRYGKREMLNYPYTLMSDMGLEDYYRIVMSNNYKTDGAHRIDKAFLDIESDIYGLSSSEIDGDHGPTNAVTVIFQPDKDLANDSKMEVHVFLLRNYERYPQQAEFEARLDEFTQVCHDEFDSPTITNNGKERTLDCKADYVINMYNTESELLTAVFMTINSKRPDMCEIWNLDYDIPTMIKRMHVNGLNHVEVMSDSSFPEEYRFVEVKTDNRAHIEVADRTGHVRGTFTTKYVDQMRNYACTRKGGKAYGSNSLDNIANIELGVGKRVFGPGIDVFNAAIADYWNFVLYNITDVWRQVMIDMMTNDTMGIVYNSNMFFTSLEALFKQTKFQRQIYNTHWIRKGYIPGNNRNISYLQGENEDYLISLAEMREAKRLRMEADDAAGELQEDADGFETDDSCYDEDGNRVNQDVANVVYDTIADYDDRFSDTIRTKLKLLGGLVGSPDNNVDNGAEVIHGIRSKHFFKQVMDNDFAAHYPWSKFTRSLSMSTQIGRLIILRKVSDKQNTLPMGQEKRKIDIDSYLPGAEFTGDYLSADILSFGNVWFGMPDISEMKEELQEWLK